MFKRLSYDEWQAMIPIIAFLITFIGFLIFSIRALFMQHERANHLSHLPLENTETASNKNDHA